MLSYKMLVYVTLLVLSLLGNVAGVVKIVHDLQYIAALERLVTQIEAGAAQEEEQAARFHHYVQQLALPQPPPLTRLP